jgi:aryl-alcohol dehydrogenase-like predicted oxidoreductase
LELVQVAYSALDRRPERRVLPAAVAAHKRVVARSLLLRGVLTTAGRELSGPFAVLAAAADALHKELGVSWEELPGAAVAFAASKPWVTYALLGPRDERELTALLDQTERFGAMLAGAWPTVPELPEWLLDPNRWPAEATVGG